MTGEMSKAVVTRENYPWHFAIADALGGTVEPFDKYQGPYVQSEKGRFWIMSEDGVTCQVYNEVNGKSSKPYWPHWKSSEYENKMAVNAALSVALK